MAFTINLQKSVEPKNQVTKTPELIDSIAGTLRDESNLVNPVILIQSTGATMAQVNYVTIPSFNRSYFVEEIKLVRSYIYELHLHVDVLRSFAAEIRSNSAIIRRNENANNILLNDGYFKVQQNPHITVVKFPNGFLGQSNAEFVLALAGS